LKSDDNPAGYNNGQFRPMDTKRITVEHVLYLILFALSLGVRLLRLGAAPLSEFEAGWALQALEVARGANLTYGPNPGYISLTGLAFFLLGSSDGLARFFPALAGSLLIWLPFIFRHQLGRRAAVLAAIGLTIDPGLVSLSRLAGGPMIAVSFGLLALGLWYARQPILAGICAGLALLGGPAILMGIAGLGIAWFAGAILLRHGQMLLSEDGIRPVFPWREVKIGLSALAGTLFVAGTLFLLYPQALGGVGRMVPAFAAGWVDTTGIPAARLIAVLVFYQPLALVFGFAASIRAWGNADPLPRWLSLWSAAALLLVLAYPGRQVGDLAWMLIPLWVLAGLELARHLQVYEWEKVPALGQTALIVILMTLAWINLAAMSLPFGGEEVLRLRWLVIGGSAALVGVTTSLVALGWSPTVAQRGLIWGFGIGLGLYTLAGMWGVSQLRANGEQELWSPPPAISQANLLMQTLGDLAEWRTGHRNHLELVVTEPGPAIRWLLRDWEGARFVTVISPTERPAAIISEVDQATPSLTAAYRGQDFAWRVGPGWEGAVPQELPAWITFRNAPQAKEHIILWARGDLFPEGSLILESEPAFPTEPTTPEDEDLIPERGLGE
jgi:hypothetical protein